MVRSIIVLVFLIVSQYFRAEAAIDPLNNHLQKGYYWRDILRGQTLPEDVWPAGKWTNGSAFYVGQIVDQYFGILPVQITLNGDPIVSTNVTVSKGLKVLCAFKKSHLFWVDTSAKSFNIDTINHRAITGGVKTNEEHQPYTLRFVGKADDEGESRIGSIWERGVEDAVMRYLSADGSEEKIAEKFQVLVYDPLIDYANTFTSKRKHH